MDIDLVANTLNGRRNLIQMACAVFPVENEMVFFLCVKRYQAQPSKTLAIAIHTIFLEAASTGRADAYRFKVDFSVNKNFLGSGLYDLYRRRYLTRILNPWMTAQNLPFLVRKTTALFRKAPIDIFDTLLPPIRNAFRDLDADAMVPAAKMMINGWRLGGFGGGEERERGMYRRMVQWSADYSRSLNLCGINTVELGLADVFDEAHLRTD